MERAFTVFVLVAVVTGAVNCGSTVIDEAAGKPELAESVPDGFDEAERVKSEEALLERDGQGQDRDEDARVSKARLEGVPSSNVSSTATAADGSRYVAGVFSGSIRMGDFVLTSRGGDDIFVARIRPDGTVAWARAVGSKRDESGPKVSFSDGRVKLVAMTDGTVDCGQGPLNTWSAETFFLCTFGTDGAPINGASFPTGRR